MADRISYTRAATTITANKHCAEIFGKSNLEALNNCVSRFFLGFGEQFSENAYMPSAVIKKLMQGESAVHTTKKGVKMNFDPRPLFGAKQTVKQKALVDLLCNIADRYQKQRKQWQNMKHQQKRNDPHAEIEPENDYLAQFATPEINAALDCVTISDNGALTWNNSIVVTRAPVAKSKYKFSKPKDAKDGQFGSWQIFNDNGAGKETDEDWFSRNFANIPKEAEWYFNAECVEPGSRLEVELTYKGTPYAVFLERGTDGKSKLSWDKSLGIVFSSYNSAAETFPIATFLRKGKNKYEVDFIPGIKPKLIAPLDDTHTQEEKEIHAASMDRNSLEKAARERSGRETSKQEVTSVQARRDPYISEWAKARAKGKCQLCGSDAPFVDTKGRPYLESHHIIWLSNGGLDSIENTVALCPNCHRKMHIVNSASDIETLKGKNKSDGT